MEKNPFCLLYIGDLKKKPRTKAITMVDGNQWVNDDNLATFEFPSFEGRSICACPMSCYTPIHNRCYEDDVLILSDILCFEFGLFFGGKFNLNFLCNHFKMIELYVSISATMRTNKTGQIKWSIYFG